MSSRSGWDERRVRAHLDNGDEPIPGIHVDGRNGCCFWFPASSSARGSWLGAQLRGAQLPACVLDPELVRAQQPLHGITDAGVYCRLPRGAPQKRGSSVSGLVGQS
eukprot:154720-Pyramimonas_sp.AAC.1